ncbi:MAG: hypothetical protein CHACPFDD_02858 [Phycisphaerae bacterium]|nr:hypothetical protein [Phycisphaerae bacterium]
MHCSTILYAPIWFTAFCADKPAALRALEEARNSVVSGRMSWTWTDHRRLPGRTFTFHSRYALNGDMILEQVGDQDGWVRYDESSGKPRSRFPELYMRNRDGVWHHARTDVRALLWRAVGDLPAEDANEPPDPGDFRDVRTLGIFPGNTVSFRDGITCLSTLGARVADGMEAPLVEWSQSQSGSRYEVVGRLADGNAVRWIINADRGWNAERVEWVDAAGSVKAECRCELAQCGEVWFPAAVDYYSGGTLVESYRVTEAALNRADDAVESSGADLGLESGFNIVPQNFRDPSGHGTLFWHDGRIITFAECKEARRTGAPLGPTLEAKKRGEHSPYMTPEQIERWERHDREMAFTSAQNKPLTEWERYVVDFCRRFALNDEQQQKAWQILRACQADGGQYLNRHKSDFYKVQADFTQARKTGNTDDLRRHNARPSELRRPIDDIFEKQLKPRLDKLPTREQRQAADKTAASQPARGAGDARP